MEEIKNLVARLQNAAYNHGYTDAGDWSDSKHDKALQASEDALSFLIRAIEKEITLSKMRIDD